MPNWKQITETLPKAAFEYSQLQQHFQTFASEVHRQVNDRGSFLKGVTCEEIRPDQTFKMTFVGKTVMFVFQARQGGRGALEGHVIACLVNSFPSNEIKVLTEFTFDKSGKSSLRTQEDEIIAINTDVGALCGALDAVALSINY